MSQNDFSQIILALAILLQKLQLFRMICKFWPVSNETESGFTYEITIFENIWSLLTVH